MARADPSDLMPDTAHRAGANTEKKNYLHTDADYNVQRSRAFAPMQAGFRLSSRSDMSVGAL